MQSAVIDPMPRTPDRVEVARMEAPKQMREAVDQHYCLSVHFNRGFQRGRPAETVRPPGNGGHKHFPGYNNRR